LDFNELQLFDEMKKTPELLPFCAMAMRFV
jgi:hypothetical protein